MSIPEPIPRSSQVLEISMANTIATRIRTLRLERGLTMEQLAERSGLSKPMISKLERAQTAGSLSSLARLAVGLEVPVTSLLRGLDEESGEAVFIRAGAGPAITRSGTQHGHHYQLLGALRDPFKGLEPTLVSMSDASEVFPIFQHPGIEWLYMLQGRLEYSVGAGRYLLTKGDSLLFRGDVPHGPSRLMRTPIQFLSLKVAVESDERHQNQLK
jgi:transcriptional regulator with XRE-family HTH domain